LLAVFVYSNSNDIGLVLVTEEDGQLAPAVSSTSADVFTLGMDAEDKDRLLSDFSACVSIDTRAFT